MFWLAELATFVWGLSFWFALIPVVIFTSIPSLSSEEFEVTSMYVCCKDTMATAVAPVSRCLCGAHKCSCPESINAVYYS